MIIWSGWGILVIVSVILGGAGGAVASILLEKMVGASAANFEPPLIMLHAAAANWLLGKVLYRNQGRVITNHKTGEQYEKKPNHSVFFIPFRAFTFIFLGIAIFLATVAMKAEPIPEYSKESYERFEKIEKKYRNSASIFGGNTPEANACAREFQHLMNEAAAESFKDGRISLKGGQQNFATYCVQLPMKVIFVTDVEDFGSYRESEVQTALRGLMWNIGSKMAQKHGTHREAEMIIHMRDDYTAEVTLRGPISGNFKANPGATSGKQLIHLFNKDTEPSSAEAIKADSVNAVDPAARVGVPKEAPADDPHTEEPEERINIAEERIWKNKEGKEMAASFISLDGGQVSFTKSDEVIYKFPLNELSEKDQALIKTHLTRKN